MNPAYRQTYRPPPDSCFVALDANTSLGFVEADGLGWFRDAHQAQRVLAAIDSIAAQENVAVLVYVHGWRHNASPGDPDVAAFKATLQHLGRVLDCREDFRELRRKATHGDPSIRVVGVYVGWRAQVWPEVGRRWPGWLTPVSLTANLPVYPTAFSRKGESGIVGQGDVRSFIGILETMYTNAAERLRRAAPSSTSAARLMSLVLVGHSYGGHLLFDATRQTIENNLSTALLYGRRGSATGRAGLLYPVPPPSDSCQRFVRGVGDLEVLINPAIEASSYRRIDELARHARYKADQVPVLLTISAENDWARSKLFPVMSWLERFAEPMLNHEQASLTHAALGMAPSQITHLLRLTAHDAATEQRAKQEILDNPAALARSECGSLPDTASLTKQLLEHPIGEATVYGDISMTPVTSGEVSMPAMVVRASSDVIDSHSDFFRVEFVDWLSEYVLGIEARKLKNIIDRVDTEADQPDSPTDTPSTEPR